MGTLATTNRAAQQQHPFFSWGGGELGIVGVLQDIMNMAEVLYLEDFESQMRFWGHKHIGILHFYT